MAEWSKAPVSGTGLYGGVGSNPTSCILINKKGGKVREKEKKEVGGRIKKKEKVVKEKRLA